MENELLAKLKLIGRMRVGEKINTKKMYIQTDTLLSKLSRSLLYPDDRENTLTFITTTIEKTFELLKEQNPRIHHIVSDLQQAIQGILNLKQTYANDLYFCCKVDVLIEEIDLKIAPYLDPEK